ncbi:hypothetical protein COCC4DRAFT_148455 [Bipolaris maydis ATCC 48331]|uniref:Secreted protein n=1 Tax=Cochliobolus heterostrophus (strain C4 / ATCC 48331 / race T) TaxID=665024 RepID=N4WYE6_COCH4|nr:hypothetical protein COCC4DRAFT_148455 [Bipolaris maydis ATCC 48331]
MLCSFFFLAKIFVLLSDFENTWANPLIKPLKSTRFLLSVLKDVLRSKIKKTYNSGDSPVVTRLTTSPPVKYLTNGERTGSSAEKSPMVVCERPALSKSTE